VLTRIDKKVNDNKELNKDELKFLYEIDNRIEGFGYQKDPRIKEIIDHRDIKSDLSFVTGYSKDQISINEKEALKGGVKFHYGDLNLSGLTSAEGLNLPETINGSFNLSGLTSAEGLNLPETINGSFNLSGLVSVEGLIPPKNIDGDFYLGRFPFGEKLLLRDKYPNLAIF